MKVIYQGGNIALRGEMAIAIPHPTDETKLLLQFDNRLLKQYYGPTGNTHCSKACVSPRTCHDLRYGWHEFNKKDLVEVIYKNLE